MRNHFTGTGPQARVDQVVGDVDEEADEQDDHGDEQDGSLHLVEVAVADVPSSICPTPGG